MLQLFSTSIVVLAFCAAGLFNALGTAATRRNFVRWGYPTWWCRLTGGLEIVVAALVAFPASRAAGLMLGAAVIAAAGITVLRHREVLSHVAPIGLFVGLLTLAAVTS